MFKQVNFILILTCFSFKESQRSTCLNYVAIVCPELAITGPRRLGYVVLKCCDCSVGALSYELWPVPIPLVPQAHAIL